jgi:hypothetical protein
VSGQNKTVRFLSTHLGQKGHLKTRQITCHRTGPFSLSLTSFGEIVAFLKTNRYDGPAF